MAKAALGYDSATTAATHFYELYQFSFELTGQMWIHLGNVVLVLRTEALSYPFHTYTTQTTFFFINL